MIIDQLPAGDVDRLRPLWLLLHAHHQAVAPQLAPYVGDEDSWSVRRELYATTLAHGGRVLVAHEGGRDLAYALAGPEPMPWPSTFAAGAEVDELLTLVVRPEARGGGIGSRLLDAIEAEGACDRMIGVVPGNDGAIALYARRGYVPTGVMLTRFGREAPAARGGAAGVERVAPGETAALRPLWLALHHHHQALAPELAPYTSDDASWALVGTRFAEIAGDGLLWRVGPAAAPVALAYAGIDEDDPLWSDTWVVERAVGEVKMLVVAAEARGRGLGTALMDAVDRELAARGVRDQVVGAFARNAPAIAFYERRGYRPAWLQMTRFAGRA